MKKFFLPAFCAGLVLIAGCSDDDSGFSLTEQNLIGGKWYYNGWNSASNKYGYSGDDVVDVIRFDTGGRMVGLEFSGDRDTLLGSWTLSEESKLRMTFTDGREEEWTVLEYSGNRMKVKSWGERLYERDPMLLEKFTGDAFLVQEYADDQQLCYAVGFRVSRDPNTVDEACALLSDNERVTLTRYTDYWGGQTESVSTLPAYPSRVRFYARIGKNNHIKFDEQLYAGKLPSRRYADHALTAAWKAGDLNSSLEVSWMPYDATDIFYRVEVFNESMDLSNPYFSSWVLPAGKSEVSITAAAQGAVNRLNELERGKKYKVRLTALIYEPGINPEDQYAAYNIQALTYVTKAFVWGE